MDSVSKKVAALREQLSQATAAKRLLIANAKRLGTPSDTQTLRDQVNGLLSKLKQHLEQGGQAASAASEAVLGDPSMQEAQKAMHVTTVQQMERQLMSIANEYPALVRGIAVKQEEAPRPSAHGQLESSAQQSQDARTSSARTASASYDAAASSPVRTTQPQQQLQQQQQMSTEVNQLEVQQMGQDIRERDQEIHQLVGSAIEIQQVAADIACLIDHQSAAVDQVAVNIENVSHNVDMGTEAVARARHRQRRFRIDCCGWLLIALGGSLGLYVGFWLL